METKFSRTEKIRMQFQRARTKGYAKNFEFVEDLKCTNPDEKAIVRINATDSSHYYLTEKSNSS